jgi:hypothetical protein
MMNGLQSLTQWSDYFNNPTGGKLGLLNAIQVSIPLPETRKLSILPRLLVPWLPYPSRLTLQMDLDVVVPSSLALPLCVSPQLFKQRPSLWACSSVLGKFLHISH